MPDSTHVLHPTMSGIKHKLRNDSSFFCPLKIKVLQCLNKIKFKLHPILLLLILYHIIMFNWIFTLTTSTF